jgi:AcrR family transcriptional regulator
MRKTRTRAEQKEVTRARLLEVASRLFTQHGYDGTSIGMVCQKARVTHGALYHHFPSKLELFEAVLARVMQEVVEAIHERTRGVSGWAKLEAACDVYLERCSDPTVLAVLLRDGPRVVPEDRFNQIDRDANEPLVVGLLQGAIDEGVLEPLPVALFARLLGAAFAQAGSAILESGGSDTTRRDARALLLKWLGATRT